LEKDSVEAELDTENKLKAIQFSIDKHSNEIGKYASNFEDMHDRIKNKVDRMEADRLWRET